MSKYITDRIAMLQHRRRQNDALVKLSQIADNLGGPRPAPLDAAASLHLENELGARLKLVRGTSGFQSLQFKRPEDALDEFVARTVSLGPDTVSELYSNNGRSGFFSGCFSRDFWFACLANMYEGFIVVLPDLASGTLLDVARDDPMRGDFCEVEWW